MMIAAIPVMAPALTGIALVFWRRPGTARRLVAGFSTLLQLAFAVWLVGHITRDGPVLMVAGGWSPAFGIALVVDPLSALMLALSAVTTCACVVLGFAEQSVRFEHPLRLPLLLLLVAGTNLAFVTADLFNLFVAFEVVLVGSTALLTLEADDWEVKHAFPYLAMNQFGSALFLVAAALAYGLFGTLNFAALAERANSLAGDPRLTALALLLLVVFGLKAGLFPLHYWLPNSYPTLPSPLGALYAALLTKVGIYALIRVYGTVLPADPVVQTALLWIAGATLIVGVLGALARDYVRGILALLLTQVGFIVMAVGFAGTYAFTAAIYYLIHHVLAMAALFMINGALILLAGTDRLSRCANLWRAAPALGVLFLLQAMSLAGMPPFSGFWGKYMILVRGLERGATALVVVALLTSLLTMLIAIDIWNRAFWRERADTVLRRDDGRWKRVAAVAGGFTLLSLWVGLQPELPLRLATQAATFVLDRSDYIAFGKREATP